MLAEQSKLEQQFVALVAEQPSLRNLPNKNKLVENQQQVLAITTKLRLGTQALCRNLKVHPIITCQTCSLELCLTSLCSPSCVCISSDIAA